MPNPNKTIECKYTTFTQGNATFLRAVGIPLAGALENDLPSHGIHHNDGALDEALSVSNQPYNAPILITGGIGVILFVGGWLTKKILDDIYTVKIQPIVKKILGEADQKLADTNTRKKHMYQLGVWYAQEQVLVLVVIVGDSFDEILNHHDLLPTIHANAVTWILENGRQKPIHFYLVEKGKANVTPLLFDTLKETHRYIK